MAQLRSVNTKFWDDPWIETLTVSEKLLFLYLITNSYANLVGIYEITIKRICFETGIDNKTVSNALERFGTVRKAYFVNDNYIFMPNWLKNQNLNTNMKKGVLTIIKELPKEVKINILGNDYLTIQEDYQSVLNTLLKYEVLEDEVLEYEVLEEQKIKYFKSFAHLKITFEENEKLIKSGYTQEQINSIYSKIENYKKNTKYKSLYLTSLDWLKREFGDKSHSLEKNNQLLLKEKHKDIIMCDSNPDGSIRASVPIKFEGYED